MERMAFMAGCVGILWAGRSACVRMCGGAKDLVYKLERLTW